ncbi:MAG TPA: thiamine phosphate synthase [Candidatus Binatia bacterium]|jgi:thiamine-phosphate pyrophosphorylase
MAVAAPRCMLVVSVADAATRAAAIAAALSAGVDTIQLRDRGAAGGELLAAATALRALTRRHGARLLVNDRLDVARAAEADGAHLPAASFALGDARRLLARGALVGRSTHAPDEASAAGRDGADYVVLGPIFATPSKAGYGAPLGLTAVAAAAAASPVAIVAIGGITPECAAAVRAAGAAGVAVVRALLDVADPGAAAAALVAALR